MGPAPSADLVGSIIGVEENDFKSRAVLRKGAATAAAAAVPRPQEDESNKQPPMQIVWRNVLIFIYLHMAAVYGFYLCFGTAKWATVAWAIFLHFYGGFGITGGAHRLWAHRSYKAKLPLRIFAAVAQTIAVQNDIYEWSRDHRVHHKFSETDADPHNARRGFFFAHVGWLLVKKHPEVKRRGATVDVSDLLEDPVVYYQRKFYVPLVVLFCFTLPALVPWYFWGESFKTAFFIASIFRYCFTLNITWLVNSAAHLWGSHPYDKNINPAENLTVAFLTSGEGWHNYHHVFPWDYKAAELGQYSMNMTTAVIDYFARIGQAYDLKTVPEKIIRGRVNRTGDGTHPYSFEDSQFATDMKEEELFSQIIPKKLRGKKIYE
jgi:stearoyl-CoA desaturase (delta-9 desaturase)